LSEDPKLDAFHDPRLTEELAATHGAEMRVVQMKSYLTISDADLERYRAIEAEMERLLTPETLQKIRDADEEARRRLIGG
jgi:hypothetical protein